MSEHGDNGNVVNHKPTTAEERLAELIHKISSPLASVALNIQIMDQLLLKPGDATVQAETAKELQEILRSTSISIGKLKSIIQNAKGK